MAARFIYLMGVLLAFAAALGACGGERPVDGAKLRDVERLWQTVPVHPGMTEVGHPSPGDGAQVPKRYKGGAPFAEVENFYREKLAGQNWQFVGETQPKDRGRYRGERLLEFRQGEYELSVRYSGDRGVELGYDYSITVGWHG